MTLVHLLLGVVVLWLAYWFLVVIAAALSVPLWWVLTGFAVMVVCIAVSKVRNG